MELSVPKQTNENAQMGKRNVEQSNVLIIMLAVAAHCSTLLS